MRTLKGYRRLIDFFTQERLTGDPNGLTRADNLATSLFIALVAVPVFALLYAQLGLRLGAAGILAAALPFGVGLWLLKYTARLALVREVLVTTIYLLITWLSWSFGGITAATALWLMLCPMLALLLGGPRTGAIWSGITLVTLYFQYRFASPAHPGFVLSPDALRALHAVSGLGLVGVVIPFFVAFDQSKRQRFRELQQEIENHWQTALLLDDSRQKYQSLFDLSPNGVFSIDRAGNFLSVNKAGEAICGYTPEELVGRPFLPLIHEADVSLSVKYFTRVIAGEAVNFEPRIVHKNGETVYLALTQMPIKLNGEIIGLFGIAQNITERRLNQEQLAWLAQYDTLTDLPNRYLFNDRLEHLIHRARRTGEKFAVLYVDLDHFKEINDTKGHETGDQVLKAVAGRLQQSVRQSDTVARQGGDEFTILLEGIHSLDGAIAVAGKIRDHCIAPVTVADQVFFLSASVGVALYPEDGADRESLLAKADQAMYQAKRNGRNQVGIMTALLHEEALDRIALKNDLRFALERNELLLHYQPQICLRQGKLIAVEALTRWRHPARGFVSPELFIPLLEETGLIIEFGRWLAREICGQIVRWDALGLPPIVVAMNVSARQLREPSFVSDLTDLLKETRVAPARVEIEITESLLIEDIALSQRVLGDLRNHGFQIALDDFGTGYSSLSYLKDLPIHRLKMDGSFTRQLDPANEGGAAGQAIARAIIALGHNLRVEIVAEAVETAPQRDWLRRHGCDIAQGHLYSPPVSPAALEQLLSRETLPV